MYTEMPVILTGRVIRPLMPVSVNVSVYVPAVEVTTGSANSTWPCASDCAVVDPNGPPVRVIDVFGETPSADTLSTGISPSVRCDGVTLAAMTSNGADNLKPLVAPV